MKHIRTGILISSFALFPLYGMAPPNTPETSTPCKSSCIEKSCKESKEKRYQCDYPECNKTFACALSVRRHQKIHTQTTFFKCNHPKCNKLFTQHSDLEKHKKTHIKKQSFKCPHPECNKAFAQRSNLRKHIRKTHKENTILTVPEFLSLGISALTTISIPTQEEPHPNLPPSVYSQDLSSLFDENEIMIELPN